MSCSKIVEYVCEECGIHFTRLTKPSRKSFRFCTKSCASKHNARGQRTYDAIYNRWVLRYGEDVAEQMLEHNKRRRAEIAIESNTGRSLSSETRDKIAQACAGIPNVLKGRTFEEFYGPEKAEELKRQHSEALKEGFAEGRIKPTAHSSNAPMFRGVRLRSLLEQRAIEFLEKRDGLTFGKTLIYEDHETCVQWQDASGGLHTYLPDLHDLINDIVYEVKPAWKVDMPTDEQRRKMHALIARFGQQCAYLTDRELMS